MEIVFDEIMVGEMGRAHDVLATNLPDEFARSLAHHLDLPGQLPPGFELDSYVSGFPHAGRYVVARTSADTSAARQGMVFSHAVVANQHEIGQLANIGDVFDRLKRSRPDKPISSTHIVRAPGEVDVSPPSPLLCDKLVTNVGVPTVIDNPDDLEQAITSLWARLLPSLRRELRFRLSFGPEESDISNFHIVAVPRVAVTRWPVSQVVSLGDDAKRPETAAGRFLCADTDDKLSDFVAELSVECSSFEVLALAGQALEYSGAERVFKNVLAALRLVAALQPDPEIGLDVKTPLLESLAKSCGPESVQEFLSLRNLDLAPFSRRAEFLDALKNQFDRLFEGQAEPSEIRSIVLSAVDESKATEDWRNACCASLGRLSAHSASVVSQLVWKLLSEDPPMGQLVLMQVSKTKFMDGAMAGSVRNCTSLENWDISDVLIDAGLFEADTAYLIASFNNNLVKALALACKRDRATYGDKAITRILDLMQPAEKVAAAIRVDDSIVAHTATNSIVDSPKLLAELSLREPKVQEIWAGALDKDHAAWNIKQDIVSLRDEVFDCFLDNEFPLTLLERLMSSPLSNSLDYRRRTELWPLLSGRYKEACLIATAEAWIMSLPERVDVNGYVDLEQELAVALVMPRFSQQLKSAMQRIALSDVLSVFAANVNLPEELFFDVFTSVYDAQPYPSSQDADQAGHLVVTRGWSEVTRRLLHRYGVSDELRGFFKICADHLHSWDRFWHGLSRPTREELVALLIDTACELYASGPMHDEIWARSGGDPSQIDLSGTGRQQWQSAIKKIRYGNQVREHALIATMQEDYPANGRLDYLAKEYQ